MKAKREQNPNYLNQTNKSTLFAFLFKIGI